MQAQVGSDWWVQAYTHLVALYPIHVSSDGERDAYKSTLAKASRKSVGQAVMRAAEAWPKHFPSAGELLAEAMRIERVSAAANAPRREPAPYVPPKLAPDNAFELLARGFELDSKRLGLDPESTTPTKIAHERARMFNALLGGTPIGVAL